MQITIEESRHSFVRFYGILTIFSISIFMCFCACAQNRADTIKETSDIFKRSKFIDSAGQYIDIPDTESCNVRKMGILLAKYFPNSNYQGSDIGKYLVNRRRFLDFLGFGFVDCTSCDWQLKSILKDEEQIKKLNNGPFNRCVRVGYSERNGMPDFILDTGSVQPCVVHSLDEVKKAIKKFDTGLVIVILTNGMRKMQQYFLVDTTQKLQTSYPSEVVFNQDLDLGNPSLIEVHNKVENYFLREYYDSELNVFLESTLYKHPVFQDFYYKKTWEKHNTTRGRKLYFFYRCNIIYTINGITHHFIIKTVTRNKFDAGVDKYMKDFVEKMKAAARFHKTHSIADLVYGVRDEMEHLSPMDLDCSYSDHLIEP